MPGRHFSGALNRLEMTNCDQLLSRKSLKRFYENGNPVPNNWNIFNITGRGPA